MIWKINTAGLTLIWISSCGQVVFAGDEYRLETAFLAQKKAAVGYYRTNNNNLSPLSYTSINGGATWSLGGALPLPGDVAANGLQNSELQGVACNSTGTYCRSVGSYLNNKGDIVPLSYTSANGGVNWFLSSPLLIPGDATQMSKLQSVACDGTGIRCIAVGFYLNNSNNIAPLSYTIKQHSFCKFDSTSACFAPY